MKQFISLTKRNIKMFFKDKGLFFTSLITPLILLLLYSTFLAKVFKDSFMSAIPTGIVIDKKIINGCVGVQLFSSLLSVSCVTVAFCSNMLMVQDKMNGVINDFTITPLKRETLALSYYTATAINSLLIAVFATLISFVYIMIVGWYFTFIDILLIFVDILLLVVFGTALSSIVNVFLSTQGQISAVGTLVSSCYGFVCGAYMPISTFGKGLRTALSFLPSTYATSLIKNHSSQSVLKALADSGVGNEVVQEFKGALDCSCTLFGQTVSAAGSFFIVFVTDLVLIAAYVAINVLKKKKKS